MSRLPRHYGITEAQYEALLKDQQGRCGICGRYPKKLRLSVDHCHETGFVRGLLCPTCNRGLAPWRDDSSLLRRAAVYLETSAEHFGALAPDEQDEWLIYRGRVSGKARRARITKAGVPQPRLPQVEGDSDIF